MEQVLNEKPVNPRVVLKKHGVDPETIQKFINFNKETAKEVWKAFEKYALKASLRRKRIGANAIMERIRWETTIEKGEDWKVNNNYAPYYARIFIAKHPRCKGLFEFRKLKKGRDENR